MASLRAAATLLWHHLSAPCESKVVTSHLCDGARNSKKLDCSLLKVVYYILFITWIQLVFVRVCATLGFCITSGVTYGKKYIYFVLARVRVHLEKNRRCWADDFAGSDTFAPGEGKQYKHKNSTTAQLNSHGQQRQVHFPSSEVRPLHLFHWWFSLKNSRHVGKELMRLSPRLLNPLYK